MPEATVDAFSAKHMPVRQLWKCIDCGPDRQYPARARGCPPATVGSHSDPSGHGAHADEADAVATQGLLLLKSG